MSEDEAVLSRRTAKLSALLRATDTPVPDLAFPGERIERARQARRRRLLATRLAAGGILLLSSAAFVPPVRAWIVGRARTVWQSVRGEERNPSPSAAAPAPAATARPDASVSFIPGSDVFRVRVVSLQESGTLTLRVTSDAAASAAVEGRRDGIGLVVLPDGLRIENAAGSTADYLVSVPSSLARAEVLVGGRLVRALEPRPGDEVTVRLGR